VAVVVVAGIGFPIFVPVTRPDGKLLGRLVISHSALSTVPRKPTLTQSVSPSQSTFAVTRKAARRDPNDTGLYAREWYISSSGPPQAGIVLQFLPTVGQARAVLADVEKQLPAPPSLPDETAVSGASFAVPGVPGARGESFLLNDTTTPSKSPVGTSYATVFRVGRAVESELIVATSAERDPQPIVADSQAEYRLLGRAEPGFSLARTHLPWASSLVFVAVTLAVAALALLAPEWLRDSVRRRRQRRHEREVRRAREQYLARGRRTVRRQKAPAWAQPRKR
jgi:hypothetical protein